LYEDEYILVVEKNGNLPTTQSGLYFHNTLTSIIRREHHFHGMNPTEKSSLEEQTNQTVTPNWESQNENNEEMRKDSPPGLFVVHRLDKETSGVVLFAKSKRMAQILSEQFQNGEIRKVYHAVLIGEMEGEIICKNPIRPCHFPK